MNKMYFPNRRKPIFFSIEKNGCFIPQNVKFNKDGYYLIKVMGITMGLHRASYILNYGFLIPRMCVRHICNNPNCINPKHLKPGTHQSNMIDMLKAGNVGNAKLTPNDARAIKGLIGYKPVKEIAKMFSISQVVVYQIKNNQIWKYV